MSNIIKATSVFMLAAGFTAAAFAGDEKKVKTGMDTSLHHGKSHSTYSSDRLVGNDSCR